MPREAEVDAALRMLSAPSPVPDDAWQGWIADLTEAVERMALAAGDPAVVLLFYVDDLVLCETSAARLQEQLARLGDTEGRLGLTVNVGDGKSEYMVIRPKCGGSSAPPRTSFPIPADEPLGTTAQTDPIPPRSGAVRICDRDAPAAGWLQIGRRLVCPVEKYTYLGVIFDAALMMASHMQQILQAASGRWEQLKGLVLE